MSIKTGFIKECVAREIYYKKGAYVNAFVYSMSKCKYIAKYFELHNLERWYA